MNFQVETHNFCNLTCSYCPNRLMERPRQNMQDEVWETILHRYIVPYWHLNEHLNPPTFIPHKDGETLIDKKLTWRLQSIAGLVPELSISIYTHGLLLKREFIEFLGTLPNRVRVLISFHFYNHDGSENDYTKATQVIRDVVRHRPQNVEIILAAHSHPPMTIERLHEWKDTWRDEIGMGTSVHVNCAINPWTGLIDGPNVAPFTGCPYQHFDHVFIGVTGNVIACCLDLEEAIVFGNVMADDPDEMIGTLGAFYAAQKRREVNHAICHNCFGLPPVNRLQQLGVVA